MMRSLRRVLLLFAVGTLFWGCASSESSVEGTVPSSPTTEAVAPTPAVTTEPTATTTTEAIATTTSVVAQPEWGEAEGSAALGLVERFYAALNTGNEAAARALFSGQESEFYKRLPIALEGVAAQFEYDCALLGPSLVKCVETVTDDLYGPAGLTHQATVHYRVHGETLSSWGGQQSFICSADPPGESAEFLVEFRTWAATAYPELETYWVWGEPIDSTLAIPCRPYPFATPEGAAAICQVVPEFINQSDRWPTDNT